LKIENFKLNLFGGASGSSRRAERAPKSIEVVLRRFSILGFQFSIRNFA
jgi:hypothetical protein